MKFTQPVSMQCSQEQFETDLQKPLEKLGYNYCRLFNFKECPIIATYMGQNLFSNTSWNFERANNRHFINHYNPQLFLALASMTDEPLGIRGEWYRCKDRSYPITYQPKHTNMCNYSWVKATKEELIAHFTSKKAREYSSPLIEELLEDKKFAEISLRIEGVLTRFIAESEYKRTIDSYEKQVKELDGRIKNQSNIIKELMEKLGKIKELL